jgi:hypothetical protein
MPKYKIWYDIGYGREEEEIEADSDDEAADAAYEAFAQACEGQFHFGYDELEAEEQEAASDE